MDNNFNEEVTPILEDSLKNHSINNNISTESTWEEEKTILLDDSDGMESLWLENTETGEKIELKQFPFSIGRSSDADLPTQHSSVSRRHAVIVKVDEENRYAIEDMNSSNGIKVNGFKTARVILNDQDKIEIGSLKFTFYIENPEYENTTGIEAKVVSDKKPFSEVLNSYKKSTNLTQKKKLGLVAAISLLAIFSVYYFTVGSRVQIIPAAVNKVEVQRTEPEIKESVQAVEKKEVEEIVVSDSSKDVSAIEPDKQNADADLISENEETLNVNNDAVGIETGKTENQVIEVSVQQIVKPEIKKIIRRSSAWSEDYIQESLNMYLRGDSVGAINRLGILSRSSRHQQKYRTQSADLAKQLEGLQQNYYLGKSLSQQGNRNAAFNTWQDFLVSENKIFPNKSSIYASDIQAEVAIEYTASGNKASLEGRWHDAYRAWQKASTVSSTGEAARSLNELQERAKAIYLDAYLKEKINIKTASILWNEVISLVPSGNEYHTKAKAKLRLYENYGTR